MHDEIIAANGDILSVAVDLKGPDVVTPFHEEASARFETVVDGTNILAELFGFKSVPNGLLVGEDGRLLYKRFSDFDIRNPKIATFVRSFLKGELNFELNDHSGGGGIPVKSMNYFRLGIERFQVGNLEDAEKAWRKGIALDPENWLLRKQLWALKNPEKFYSGGKIDLEWQKAQIAAGL